MYRKAQYALFSLMLLIAGSSPAFAAEGTPVLEADRRVMNKAMAHYARSRQLLIDALREFDKGYQSVNPGVIFDGSAFRSSILERTAELEKLLAPQARVDPKGLHFNPHPAFLTGADER